MSNLMDKISNKLSGKDSHENYSADQAKDDFSQGKQRLNQHQQQRSHDSYGTSTNASDDYGHQQGIRSGQQESFGSSQPQFRDEFSSNSGVGSNQVRGGQHTSSGYAHDQSLGGAGELQTQDSSYAGNQISGQHGIPQQSQYGGSAAGRQTRSQGAARSAGLGAQDEWGSQGTEGNEYGQTQSKKIFQQGYEKGVAEGEKYINRNM
ncbi:hypothetical protein WICPIJ_002968 [Wickerhamomyces pijperi]|uniref:Uncharacterized protein n=1 Tax=Wickerhamomyces pijperi TaxID=599730 RepID=A0A9P8QAT7_WICPI|nr:hypothetical protein WICPIJ_002968 [Wickerhamomyces pijperi]